MKEPRAGRGEAEHAIILAHESDFTIGALEVRPETRELLHGDSSRVVEPRVMQVLVALHQASGHVVSRDDLLQRCWQGRIVGDDAIHRVISRAATEGFCGSYASRESRQWLEVEDCRRSVVVSARQQLARSKAGEVIRIAARSR